MISGERCHGDCRVHTEHSGGEGGGGSVHLHQPDQQRDQQHHQHEQQHVLQGGRPQQEQDGDPGEVQSDRSGTGGGAYMAKCKLD